MELLLSIIFRTSLARSIDTLAHVCTRRRVRLKSADVPYGLLKKSQPARGVTNPKLECLAKFHRPDASMRSLPRRDREIAPN